MVGKVEEARRRFEQAFWINPQFTAAEAQLRQL